MTVTLQDRAVRTYSQLTDLSRRIVTSLESSFDYSSPAALSGQNQVIESLQQSQLPYSQRRLVADYVFLRVAVSALRPACIGFVNAYDSLKYHPDFTLPFFLLGGDTEHATINLGEFTRNSDIIKGLVRHLELTKELKGYIYEDGSELLEGLDAFTQEGIISTVSSNHRLINETLVDSLNPDPPKRFREIALDQEIAIEAANTLLDAYAQGGVTHLRKGLEFFFDRYAIGTRELMSKASGGNYRPLLRRLLSENGLNWRDSFYSKLPEGLVQRIILLEGSLNLKGTREEDKIKLVEKLVLNGGLSHLTMFADDGTDLDDLLIASRITHLSQDERRMLLEVNRGGISSIGRYLGMCRIPQRNSEVSYDAKRFFDDACATIDPEVFQKDEVIADILIKKKIRLFEPDFTSDPEGTISLLERESMAETSPVNKELILQAIKHFKLRQKVKGIEGIVNNLVVIR